MNKTKEVVALDFDASRGCRSYDFGSAALLQNNRTYEETIDNAQQLASYFQFPLKNIIGWALFRCLATSSFYCDRDEYDKASQLITVAQPLRKTYDNLDW